VLTTASYWPSSHCIPDQKFVSVSGELNHNRSPLVLDSRQRCVLSLYLFIVYTRGGQITARGPHPARPPVLSDPPNTLHIFFKCHVSDCGQQCNSINCCLSRKLHCIQAVAHSWPGSRAFGPRVKLFSHRWSTWIGWAVTAESRRGNICELLHLCTNQRQYML